MTIESRRSITAHDARHGGIHDGAKLAKRCPGIHPQVASVSRPLVTSTSFTMITVAFPQGEPHETRGAVPARFPAQPGIRHIVRPGPAAAGSRGPTSVRAGPSSPATADRRSESDPETGAGTRRPPERRESPVGKNPDRRAEENDRKLPPARTGRPVRDSARRFRSSASPRQPRPRPGGRHSRWPAAHHTWHTEGRGRPQAPVHHRRRRSRRDARRFAGSSRMAAVSGCSPVTTGTRTASTPAKPSAR